MYSHLLNHVFVVDFTLYVFSELHFARCFKWAIHLSLLAALCDRQEQVLVSQVFFFGLATWLSGSWFPDQEWNQGSLQ